MPPTRLWKAEVKHRQSLILRDMGLSKVPTLVPLRVEKVDIKLPVTSVSLFPSLHHSLSAFALTPFVFVLFYYHLSGSR